MPNTFHSSNTPEALLGRNDSKNPASTCKGITKSGRPCRRDLATPKSSLAGRNDRRYGVVAVVDDEAAFYCWQHQNQANPIQEQFGKQGRSAQIFPLHERSSIETLVQKLSVEEGPQAQSGRRPRSDVPKPPCRTQTRDFAIPPEAQHAKRPARKQEMEKDSKPKNKTPGFWASLCCMASDDTDRLEVVRHRRRVERQSQPWSPHSASLPSSRPPSTPHPTGQTAQLMSLIPSHLSPATTSALLAELIKPITPADEPGYIYIFWLTPTSRNAPSESTAKSLLSAPEQRPRHARRVSDVMTEYSFCSTTSLGSEQRNSILLKIGRASNVTRRMNEWQRQCGYELSLVRWYPYLPTSPPATPHTREQVTYPDLSRPPSHQQQRKESDAVRKVPYVKRVERLIHLELAEKQAKRQCEACGKEHREWFEVEASHAGVKAVDACVRRWVAWSEGNV